MMILLPLSVVVTVVMTYLVCIPITRYCDGIVIISGGDGGDITILVSLKMVLSLLMMVVLVYLVCIGIVRGDCGIYIDEW